MELHHIYTAFGRTWLSGLPGFRGLTASWVDRIMELPVFRSHVAFGATGPWELPGLRILGDARGPISDDDEPGAFQSAGASPQAAGRRHQGGFLLSRAAPERGLGPPEGGRPPERGAVRP